MKTRKLFLIVIFSIFFLIFVIATINILKWAMYSDNTKKETNYLNEISEKETIENEENNNVTYYDDSEFVKNIGFIDVNFDKLNIINNSTVGWIKVNGTDIDYPFVQAADNSYYLTHSFHKKYNPAGWIFLDYRNNAKLTDKNTIIYGHTMNDNTMFGSLKNVLKNSWLNNKDNHIVVISTKDYNSIWQVFSVYTTPTTPHYLQIHFNNDFLDFTNNLINKSIFNFNTKVEEDDRILTLSTCYTKTHKTVLHAKLVKLQYK